MKMLKAVVLKPAGDAKCSLCWRNVKIHTVCYSGVDVMIQERLSKRRQAVFIRHPAEIKRLV